MARFIIRNYGPSRQIPCGKNSICLSNDQCIETDDAGMADVLGKKDNIHVTDRGVEAITASPEELAKMEKEHQVTVDDAEAVYDETHPNEDDRQQQEDFNETIDESDEMSYDDMTVEELRNLAEDRGMEFPRGYVKRDDLIEALVEYDEEE